MMRYKVRVVFVKEPEDEGYYSWSPTLRGCFSNGLTLEETREHMREAVEMFIESMLAHGEPIPEIDDSSIGEEMEVAVEDVKAGAPA